MCADCVLASLRITQVDPGDEPLSEVVLSHIGARKLTPIMQFYMLQNCDRTTPRRGFVD
jgi:hypothetical protein